MPFDSKQFETEFDQTARHLPLAIEHVLKAMKVLADGLIESAESLQALPITEAKPESLIERKELAERMSVSVSTIRNMEKKGMPVIHVNSSSRFDYADVKAWCMKQPLLTRKKPRKTKTKV
jgi:DNA-binding transcriptional regulator YiaG